MLIETEDSPLLAESIDSQARARSTRPPRLDPYRVDGILYRTVPFIVTIAFGIALLPLQELPIDGPLLALSLAGLTLVIATALVVGRFSWVPWWAPKLLPILYLLPIALLREATGGTTSGYGALLFLAPFFVALYDTRTQVLVVTAAMFVVQASQGLVEAGAFDPTALRRAMLSAVVVGLISLIVQRNVSALRRAEEFVREEADARAEANARLAEANDALMRSNRDLEQFAYISSHDLQEPLRMIRSFSQLFVQHQGDRMDDEGRELLGFVVDGAERAQSMVNDLLEYSRVGTSKGRFGPVDLDDALDRALQVLATTIDEAGATVEHPDDLPVVRGDAIQLERVFVNLIGNALRYRHDERAPVLRITCEPAGPGTVQVRVRDNGIGFDNEHSERIFLLFQRLHSRTDYEGTGLGLAICSRIVEQHGGTITAEGHPGEGAEFRFTLEAAA